MSFDKVLLTSKMEEKEGGRGRASYIHTKVSLLCLNNINEQIVFVYKYERIVTFEVRPSCTLNYNTLKKA